MTHTMLVELIACCILGGLYGSIRAYGRRLRKRKEYEQRELARWQAELEKQASEQRKTHLQ